MLCEKLESGKLLQFIVFQTFDSKLLFLKLNYGSRTREGNENVRDQSSCQISGNLGLTNEMREILVEVLIFMYRYEFLT